MTDLLAVFLLRTVSGAAQEVENNSGAMTDRWNFIKYDNPNRFPCESDLSPAGLQQTPYSLKYYEGRDLFF